MAALACVGAATAPHALAQEPGRIVAWGQVTPLWMPPQGLYTRVAIGGAHALALRPDGTMVGWGSNFFGQAVAQPGTFVDIAAGEVHSVALRSDGVAVSWGRNDAGEGITPAGTFVAISASNQCSAGVRTDGSLHIWGVLSSYPIPQGSFLSISVGGASSAAAIRTDGTMVTWAQAPPALSGAFSAVNISCLATALRIDGSAVTFGICGNPLNYPAPPGPMVQLNSSASGGFGALRADGSIAVWGPQPMTGLSNPPSGRRFSFVVMGPGVAYAIKPCYADCDGNSSGPLLSANDFMCFLNKFASADPYVNCDLSTAAPILNANDFQCFLNKFAAGCS